MKLAIIGSRTCQNIDIEGHLEVFPDTIISGGARGADTYAKAFALRHSLNLIEFLPEYDKYPPRVAPLMRNKQIVENCDYLIAFWDGKSKGTKYTLDYAKKLGRPYKIILI